MPEPEFVTHIPSQNPLRAANLTRYMDVLNEWSAFLGREVHFVTTPDGVEAWAVDEDDKEVLREVARVTKARDMETALRLLALDLYVHMGL